MLGRDDLSTVPYRTTGQVAKSLRVSVSTLKRWLEEAPSLAKIRNNASGWRLFSPEEIVRIREYQKEKRKQGRTFRPDTLRPVDDA